MITFITTLPILFMIVGAFLYLLSIGPNAKVGSGWGELGRIMFAAGAFALAFALAGKTVALMK